MSRYLLTPSLHSSWYFYHLMEAKTKQDFLEVLLKKPLQQTEAMLDGIRFEDNVRSICDGPSDFTKVAIKGTPAYADCVREVASIVRGGLRQEKVYTDTSLCGRSFLLYGKADVVKREWVYDIKFTGNYDIGKYSNSIQHLLYMHCSGLPKFAYLITDGRSVWREDYFLDDQTLPRLRGELSSMIDNIMADPDFKRAYIENWTTYPDRNANVA
jgi:hypothetical protein